MGKALKGDSPEVEVVLTLHSQGDAWTRSTILNSSFAHLHAWNYCVTLHMCQRLNTGESNNFYFGIFTCIVAFLSSTRLDQRKSKLGLIQACRGPAERGGGRGATAPPLKVLGGAEGAAPISVPPAAPLRLCRSMPTLCPRGTGMIFFLVGGWGGGGNVDMPSDCQNLGRAQAYSSHWDKKLGGNCPPCPLCSRAPALPL